MQLNAVKSVLADVLSVSPSSEQRDEGITLETSANTVTLYGVQLHIHINLTLIHSTLYMSIVPQNFLTTSIHSTHVSSLFSAVAPDAEPLGCYNLFKKPPKKGAAFGKVYYRRRFKKADPKELIETCANKANKFNLIMMGVTTKVRGKFTLLKCRTATKNPEKRYKKHGKSSECKNGIGGMNAMSVYRVKEKRECVMHVKFIFVIFKNYETLFGFYIA